MMWWMEERGRGDRKAVLGGLTEKEMANTQVIIGR